MMYSAIRLLTAHLPIRCFIATAVNLNRNIKILANISDISTQ